MIQATSSPSSGLYGFLLLPIRYTDLIRQLSWREILGRYQGSFFGLAWSFFNPLLLLVVYTLFFTEALGMHEVMSGGSRTSFANSLFVGLIIHGFFAECAMRGPRLVIGNTSYVKKIVFPLEVLPWISTLSASFHTLVSLIVLLLFVAVSMGSVPITFPLVVLVLVPLFVLCLATGWFLAALGVYVRDIGQMVGLLTTAMLFTAPVFFPISRLEDSAFATVVKVNPLTFLINQAREVALWGRLPDFAGLALYTVVVAFVAWLAYAWFQRARRGFADVL